MRIRVQVKPSARKESFVVTKPNVFEIQVKELAEGNAANKRIRALIAAHFRIPLKSVRFVTGMRGRNKTFDVLQ